MHSLPLDVNLNLIIHKDKKRPLLQLPLPKLLGVCGGNERCEIPFVAQQFFMTRYSLPLSVYSQMLGVLKYFSTMDLNLMKISKTLNLCCIG